MESGNQQDFELENVTNDQLQKDIEYAFVLFPMTMKILTMFMCDVGW